MFRLLFAINKRKVKKKLKMKKKKMKKIKETEKELLDEMLSNFTNHQSYGIIEIEREYDRRFR